MKFFITSETDRQAGEKTDTVLRELYVKIPKFLAEKNYGEGIDLWFYIFDCFPQSRWDSGWVKERTLFSRKETASREAKSTDFRLKVDYDKMLVADEKEAYKLICESILRSVDIGEAKKIKDFDFTAFRNDLTQLFKKEGWM